MAIFFLFLGVVVSFYLATKAWNWGIEKDNTFIGIFAIFAAIICAAICAICFLGLFAALTSVC